MTEENSTVQRGMSTSDVKAMIPGLVVAFDAVFAIVFWVLRENILGQNENTDMIAGIICGALIVGGIFTSFALKHIFKR